MKPLVKKEIHRVDANIETGLTMSQVKERMENGWNNHVDDASVRSVRSIIFENVCTYFNFIFLVLSILLCMVGSFRNLTFLPIIFLNTIIGIVQEIRAKKVLDEMNMLNAPHAKVVREGTVSIIPSEELVVDDIVIFSAGNQICADAMVVDGTIQVNESLLTGESDEISKGAGDPLMSGSFVVSGECRARLEQVGMDSYISKLTAQAKAMGKKEQSEMIRSLNQLLKWVGIAIIPIGAILLLQSIVYNHETIRVGVTAMVAALIGMIPEGLYLLTSIALAVSAMRLARQQVLLHDMKSIETLARVDVLCVDKTGTITENAMSVVGVELSSICEGKKEKEEVIRELGDFVGAMSADNITMEVLKSYFVEITGRQAISKTSFSSAYKYSSVTFEDGAYVLGAPEMVLREEYKLYEPELIEQTRQGYRVLVYGKYEGEVDGKRLTQPVTPYAYVVLANQIRENAKETFSYFEQQGVEIKVISGDNPVTVSEVAQKAGIANAEQYVDATSLNTAELLEEAVEHYTVFGRVTPEQKRELVHALQQKGHTVAMTGDGVNDVLALKDADCSIAMASGSEAASQAAQVVLLESDFSRMPSVVLEGRRVVNNIERSASLFLVKNIYSLLLAVISVLAMITYPFEPAQISLISMFTIGLPGFFLALETNTHRIQGKFITNVLAKALPAAVTDVIAVCGLLIFAQVFEVGARDISTAGTILLSIVGFMILYKISQPFNKLRGLVWGGCILGLVICNIFLKHWFSLYDMSRKCVFLFLVFSVATESVFRNLSKGMEALQERWKGKH